MNSTRFYIVVIFCLALLSCHNDNLTPQQRKVRRAAMQAMTDLRSASYDKYIDAMADAECFSDGYRQQLSALLAQHVADIQQQRGGWQSVDIVGDDIWGDSAMVFVQMTFADSTSEEVMLPMVCDADGEWHLR